MCACVDSEGVPREVSLSLPRECILYVTACAISLCIRLSASAPNKFTMNNNNCAACRATILNDDYFECSRCKDYYHYLCLNYHDLDDITSDMKSSWLCPNCISKQPKGNNTNDLVRPSTPTSLAEMTFVATRRKGQQNKQDTDITSCSECVSRAEMRNIVRDEIKQALKISVDELNKTLNSHLRVLNEQYSELKAGIDFINDQFESLKSDVQTHDKEIKSLRKENDFLRSELISMNGRLKLMDQLSRSSNLELQCVPEHRSENIISLLKQLGKVVNYPIIEADVLHCSRVAKMSPNSTRPRSILLKLGSPRTRDSLLAAVINYNKSHPNEKINSSTLGIDDKKTPIFVVENLSPENKSLHAAARLRAKELNYKFVWVRGGRIFMRKSESSEPIYVRDTDILKKIS